VVVCAGSLKRNGGADARFIDRRRAPCLGPRRALRYREPTFFTIVNYEQVLSDAQDINDILQPDVLCSMRRSASRTGRSRPRDG